MRENPNITTQVVACFCKASFLIYLNTWGTEECKIKLYALNLEALNIPNSCRDQHRAVSSFPTFTKS